MDDISRLLLCLNPYINPVLDANYFYHRLRSPHVHQPISTDKVRWGFRCCFSDPRINSASVLSLGCTSSLTWNQKKRASSADKQMTPIYNIKQSHHRVQTSSFKDGVKTGFPVYSKRSPSSACLLKIALLLVFASIFNIFIPLSPPD